MQPLLKKLVWGIPLMVVVIILSSAAVMWLWNHLIPGIFAGPAITFWEALGLLALGKLLTGTIGAARTCGLSKKQDWKRTWAAMSNEEKQAFQEKYKHRCRTYGHREKQPTDVS